MFNFVRTAAFYNFVYYTNRLGCFYIHPKHKKGVSERLALLARNKIYNENIVCEAPEVDKFERLAKNINISFNNTGSELKFKGEKVNGLQVFADGQKITEFNYRVKNNIILIESEQFDLSSKIEIRFAWTPYVEVNLYNSAGLPAKPFRIVI